MNYGCYLKFSSLRVLSCVTRSRFYIRLAEVASMGLLTEGSPLSWEETKALAEHVRRHGIEQFINLYSKLRDRTGDVLKWGDEVSQ